MVDHVTQTDGFKVSVLLRTIVATFTTLVVFLPLVVFDLGGGIQKLRAVDYIWAVLATLVQGGVSGFGLAARALGGMLLITPAETVPDWLIGRPEALSPKNIANHLVGATLATISLPWLDPPQGIWRWSAARAGSARFARRVVVYAGWGVAIATVGFVCGLPGLIVGELVAIGGGGVPELTNDGWERLGFAALAIVLAGWSGVVAAVIRTERGVRWQAIRIGAAWSLLIAGVLMLNRIASGLAIVAGIGSYRTFPRGIYAEDVAELTTQPLGYVSSSLGSLLFVWVALFPFVFGLLRLDARARQNGSQSIWALLGMMVVVTLLGFASGYTISSIIGGALSGPDAAPDFASVGRIVGVLVAAGGFGWFWRRRAAAAVPDLTWPEKTPEYVALPDIVADAVNDAVKSKS